jgi:hypothetical protein
VTSGLCSRPVPALTCVAGNGRVRSSGEDQGRLFRPGVTGEGKAGRVNDPESLLMPRQSDIPGRLAVPGWQGPAVARRQTATADALMVAGTPSPPGVKRTPGPAASHARGTWKPRQGPVAPPGRGRQADRKESRIPWREQDAQKANAGGRKAAGKRERMTGPPAGCSSYNRPDTGPGARLRKQADVRRVSLCRRSTGNAGTEGQVGHHDGERNRGRDLGVGRH